MPPYDGRMTSTASKAARKLDFPVDDFKRSYSAAEVEDLIARNWRRTFPTSAGRVPVELRCKRCGAILPLPPAVGLWCDPEGRAPQPVVYSLRSADGGVRLSRLMGRRGAWPAGRGAWRDEATGDPLLQRDAWRAEVVLALPRSRRMAVSAERRLSWKAAEFEQWIGERWSSGGLRESQG